jgi:hypothetical protein
VARPEVRDRQYTIYLPSKDDIARWRKLSKPLTLNRWIYEMVERSIENKPSKNKDTEELNALRKENLGLKKDLEIAMAKLQQKEEREREYVLERSKGGMLLDKQIIDLLRAGGSWTSQNIISRIMTTGGIHLSERRKAVKRTLDELERTGLIELTSRGWKWIK